MRKGWFINHVEICWLFKHTADCANPNANPRNHVLEAKVPWCFMPMQFLSCHIQSIVQVLLLLWHCFDMIILHTYHDAKTTWNSLSFRNGPLQASKSVKNHPEISIWRYNCWPISWQSSFEEAHGTQWKCGEYQPQLKPSMEYSLRSSNGNEPHTRIIESWIMPNHACYIIQHCSIFPEAFMDPAIPKPNQTFEKFPKWVCWTWKVLNPLASELVMFVLAALVYVCASRSLAVPVKKSGHGCEVNGRFTWPYGCWWWTTNNQQPTWIWSQCVFFLEMNIEYGNMVVGCTFTRLFLVFFASALRCKCWAQCWVASVHAREVASLKFWWRALLPFLCLNYHHPPKVETALQAFPGSPFLVQMNLVDVARSRM